MIISLVPVVLMETLGEVGKLPLFATEYPIWRCGTKLPWDGFILFS